MCIRDRSTILRESRILGQSTIFPNPQPIRQLVAVAPRPTLTVSQAVPELRASQLHVTEPIENLVRSEPPVLAQSTFLNVPPGSRVTETLRPATNEEAAEYFRLHPQQSKIISTRVIGETRRVLGIRESPPKVVAPVKLSPESMRLKHTVELNPHEAWVPDKDIDALYFEALRRSEAILGDRRGVGPNSNPVNNKNHHDNDNDKNKDDRRPQGNDSPNLLDDDDYDSRN
eukprot:TRINITY_DN14710_c0_g2_i2.p1 TRINITY_DN14710_c0_g2~~TRINITY_DN14710_c0_g2_i2.p1  ORF type:complete len:229 (-),score=25.73 TRINITY_DN14710_c0_g2_i2:178-864(-)